LKRDGTALVSSLILLFIFGLDGEITRIEGIVMLLLYVVYYIVLMKTQRNHEDDNSEGADYSNAKLALFLIAGLVTLIGSSHVVVENAMLMAEKWGVAQSFVGIAIIGLGTSLPELAVSVGAALKKSAGMSVGNVIGSNIFDGLIPIGLGGTISTVKVEQNLLMIDVPVLFGATALVLFFLSTKKGISKLEGISMIVMFVLYLLLKIYSM
jgi:cation:H+ antiporter